MVSDCSRIMVRVRDNKVKMKIQFNSNIKFENKDYLAHNVPCKIRYSGPSDEFVDNFKFDDELTSRTEYINYLRGHKIVGRDVKELFGEEIECYVTESNAGLESNGTLKDENGNMNDNAIQANIVTPVSKVSKLINYEREGNESRLEEEMNKFKESLELSEIIHG